MQEIIPLHDSFLLSLSFLLLIKKRKKENEEVQMTACENHDTEYKEEYVTGIGKEVVAFANTNGETIYIGVRGDRSVCGFENLDDTMHRAASSLRDTIAPDIMPFVSIKTIKKGERNVVEIKVSTGTNSPYYLKERGLRLWIAILYIDNLVKIIKINEDR